jgi:RNA polymerase sigma-70 factor (ECF subfamily)
MAIPSASPVSDQDRRLLERVARGDETALSTLYDRYAGSLYALAGRITGDRADAEEVVLDAFQQAWRDAERFRQERGSVAAWLTMICRSRALDLVRARGRRDRAVNRAGSATPEDAVAMGRGPDPTGQAVEGGERHRMIAAALEGLPPVQRQAIELAFFEGLSQSEIADRLGEPLGTIKTRVRLGMQKLRDSLRPYFFEANL